MGRLDAWRRGVAGCLMEGANNVYRIAITLFDSFRQQFLHDIQ